MRLTKTETDSFRKFRKGCYFVQPGMAIRFGRHFWFERAATILTWEGDNTPTVAFYRKIRGET